MPEQAEHGFADVDLHEIEATVRRALAAGSGSVGASDLAVLGYGEISLVVGWPSAAPTVACKRLPVFASEAAAQRYRERFEAYLGLIEERGLRPVASEFRCVESDRGAVAGYVVQPALASQVLGPNVLRGAEPDPAHPMISAVIEAVMDVVDDRTGLDAQISNWAHDTTGLAYLDVTTPMLFDESGHLELDIDLFLAAYPWALRGVIGRFVAPGVIGAYRDPRRVLVDLAANLLKERLSGWVPATLEAINSVVSPAVTPEEVERYYRSDARLWELMLRLRRIDRWWQRSIRRRDYPFLLPGHIER